MRLQSPEFEQYITEQTVTFIEIRTQLGTNVIQLPCQSKNRSGKRIVR